MEWLMDAFAVTHSWSEMQRQLEYLIEYLMASIAIKNIDFKFQKALSLR